MPDAPYDTFAANREFERFLFGGLSAPRCDDFSPHPSPLECNDYSQDRTWEPHMNARHRDEDGEVLAIITYDLKNRTQMITFMDGRNYSILC